MKIGTKSVLFGAHCFFLHPFFVAWGWWKLYGFPTQPWLWIAFFVHDLGYVGKENMDGEEGEWHPLFGAHLLYWIQGLWCFLRQPVFYHENFTVPLRWWHLKRRWMTGQLLPHSMTPVIWGNEVYYHSRFLSKHYGVTPSRLCWADKLAAALTPWWLYVPMCRVTGEIQEYRSIKKHQEDLGRVYDRDDSFAADKAWFLALQVHCQKLADDNAHTARA